MRRLTTILPILVAGVPVAAASPDHRGQAEVVMPFFAKYCTECHGEKKQKAGISLHDLPAGVVDGGRVEDWQSIYDMLSLGEMPPEDEPQPAAKEAARVAAWIRQELENGGRSARDKRLLPTHGNYVDHEALFDQPPRGVAQPPARLWRLRPEAYGKAVQAIAKNSKTARPFSMQSGGGFRDYANLYKLDDGTLGLLLGNAQSIAKELSSFEVEGGKLQRGRSTPEVFMRILAPGDTAPAEADLIAAIDWQFGRVLQRPPGTAERDQMLEFLKVGIERNGRVLGLRNMLAAVLLTPEALYRMELGTGELDAHGRVRLSGREIAYAISYALSDSRPDDRLLEAAEKGELDSAEGVAGQVGRLLDEPKFDKPRLLGFFREYFGYPGAADVFKDEKLNPAHRPEGLVSDTDLLVRHVLERDQDVFRELLTTQKSFVNYRLDPKTGPGPADPKRLAHLSYNLPRDWKFATEQPIELPGEQRAGILTQPSWLVANSDNFDNHIIHRGKWVREKLLGGTIPDLPITVDAKLPDEPHEPLRHRMRVTREEACWRCHERMNPLGEPFEMFDHFGRWRVQEQLVDKVATEANVDSKGNSRGTIHHRVPLDSTGEVAASGDPKVDGEVPDAIAMIHRIAKSDRARQVMIRHVFRYYLGRNETLDDAATLQAADRAYLDSGGSYKALLVSLLTSDSFLMRKGDGAP